MAGSAWQPILWQRLRGHESRVWHKTGTIGPASLSVCVSLEGKEIADLFAACVIAAHIRLLHPLTQSARSCRQQDRRCVCYIRCLSALRAHAVSAASQAAGDENRFRFHDALRMRVMAIASHLILASCLTEFVCVRLSL